MRLSRIIGSAVATLATVGAFAVAGSPAQAQQLPQPPYPPQPPALTVSDPTVGVNQTFTVFGSGYGGNELVRLVFRRTPLALGAEAAVQDSGGVGAMLPIAQQAPTVHRDPTTLTVQANVTGEFSVRVRFGRTGTITITGTGLTTGRVASTTVGVVLAQPPLPVTGSETGPQIALGTMLLIAGVLLVLVAVAWRTKSRRRGRSRELTSVG
ncbi:hypothetical protein GCM10022225_53580 [Plantactinospora mayteni]|uniref:LPXTG cell wall anchor domain-containing protein n=1 Tax=Plantactinospora mayteni TaxID=566021 RepID=A0ABQ4EJS5_9ACTN|nr:hypothetical protein [Plantactinospora mayteni]GIG94976.1 hypothetical protein Pma05_15490 [Plantactinospora mayteni]